MTNSESLDFIYSANVDVHIQLSNMDHLAEAVKESNVAIANLSAECKRIRDNGDHMEAKTRVSKLSNTTWMLDLARSDLKAIEQNLDLQKKNVIQVGIVALRLLMRAYGTLLVFKRRDAEEMVRRTFDLTKLPVAADKLAQTQVDVVHAKEMQTHFWQIQLDHPAMMLELRQLSRRLDDLRLLVEAQPGLVLDLEPENKPAVKPVAAESIALTELAIA